MDAPRSDALVFFGATGDLAYKKIFPTLQAMVERGHLEVPIVGVAKSGWNLERFRARMRDSLEKHGGIVPAAFDTLMRPMRELLRRTFCTDVLTCPGAESLGVSSPSSFAPPPPKPSSSTCGSPRGLSLSPATSPPQLGFW